MAPDRGLIAVVHHALPLADRAAVSSTAGTDAVVGSQESGFSGMRVEASGLPCPNM
jgi:hypothetical protein